jgi:hypothetical protein
MTETRLILPWHHEALLGWLVMEMHHSWVDGELCLFVGMGRKADGEIIAAEGPDDKTIWCKLIRKAAEAPAPDKTKQERWREEIRAGGING